MATTPRAFRRSQWRTQTLLGKTFIERQRQPILTIGTDTWTRQEVVDNLHCGHFVAAHNLTRIAKQLHAESLDHLITHFSLEEIFQQPNCGLTTVYVLMCAQEARHHDPLAWVDRPTDQLVTLGTEQRRARKQARETRKAARTAARRAQKTLSLETTNGAT